MTGKSCACRGFQDPVVTCVNKYNKEFGDCVYRSLGPLRNEEL